MILFFMANTYEISRCDMKISTVRSASKTRFRLEILHTRTHALPSYYSLTSIHPLRRAQSLQCDQVDFHPRYRPQISLVFQPAPNSMSRNVLLPLNPLQPCSPQSWSFRTDASISLGSLRLNLAFGLHPRSWSQNRYQYVRWSLAYAKERHANTFRVVTIRRMNATCYNN